MRSKITSFDIADRAGVSQSTVSRALSNSPLVNQATKDKVLAAAKELDYRVDKNASNLRRQSSNTIALLLFEETPEGTESINPFYLSMLGSITRACANQGYDLLVSFQQLSDNMHREYEDAHKADGLILLGYGNYLDYHQKLLNLQSLGAHFVRWGATGEQYPGVTIGCDNRTGGFELTSLLLDKGCNNIAFLGDVSANSPELQHRFQGYVDAHNHQGTNADSFLQLHCDISEESGYQATKKLLASGAKFDAIFGACDYIALGAIRALKESNVEIPQQVKVVGFDDIPMAKYGVPPLTTAIQDPNLAGRELVNSLLKLIKDEPCASQTLATQLVIRDST